MASRSGAACQNTVHFGGKRKKRVFTHTPSTHTLETLVVINSLSMSIISICLLVRIVPAGDAMLLIFVVNNRKREKKHVAISLKI